jgi:hypothetical protein
MMNLAAIDAKLGDLVALIAYYTSLSMALDVLQDDPMPTGHTFFLAPLVDMAKTTFKNDAKKSVIKQLAAIVSKNKKTANVHDIRSLLKVEIENCRIEFNTLSTQRSIMQEHISNATVSAIIKSAKTKTTVAKARAHVKKSASKSGVSDHKVIKAYLE